MRFRDPQLAIKDMGMDALGGIIDVLGCGIHETVRGIIIDIGLEGF